MSPLELFASAIGVIAVWLTVRQNPWCWPLGLVMVLLYSWIFFEVRLYSNMLLQVFFAGTQLYGWWQWTRGSDEQQGLVVSRLTAQGLLASLALGTLGSLSLGYAMAIHTDAELPWWDASLTAFSLVAQLWMAQKRLECWALWIVLDVLYVAQFLYQTYIPTAVLYGLFTLLAIHGWRTWRRDPALAPA